MLLPLRVLVTVTCAAAVTILFVGGAVVVRIAVLPLLWVVSLMTGYSVEKGLRWILRGLLSAFVVVLRVVGLVKVRYTGWDKRPVPGAVIIANHPSLLDVVVLLAKLPDVICVAKSSLFRLPVFGPIIGAAGYLANDRIDECLTLGASALRRGTSLLVFPEGTRTPPGGRLHPFSPTGIGLAVRAGVPIVPILLRCSPACLFKGQKLWELHGAPFEFEAALCDPRFPPSRGDDVASERAARAAETQRMYAFFAGMFNKDLENTERIS